MQENDVERKGNTNLKGISFTSILWVLELIDRALVYWVFLLQVENEVRIEFSRKKHRMKKVIQKWQRSERKEGIKSSKRDERRACL